jgi:hypothetical protein
MMKHESVNSLAYNIINRIRGRNNFFISLSGLNFVIGQNCNKSDLSKTFIGSFRCRISAKFVKILLGVRKSQVMALYKPYFIRSHYKSGHYSSSCLLFKHSLSETI